MRSRTLRRHAGCLVFASLLLPAPAAAQHFPPDDALASLLRYVVEDGEAPGVALGVLDADGSTSVITYGSAGPGARPLGPGSVFEIGQVTMTFTATLLAEMVDRGEVAMDDPVATYLPQGVTVPSISGYEITLGHLAEHRSGLPPEPPEAYPDFTVDDLYALLAEYELDWVPGRRHELSTLGYGLLGHALARAAGRSLEALLRERVLEPLGMDRTGYGPDGPPEEWLVRGHEGGDVVTRTRVTEALQGGAGLLSSAEDMVAFLAANARPPQTALERAMRVAQEVRTPYDPEGEGRGFSWRTYSSARQQLLVTHGGRTGGFTSLINFDPDQGIGTVLLANTRDFNDWAARDLLFFGTPPALETVPVDPEVLARYVGAYGGRGDRYRASLNRGTRFIRLEDDGYLTYQPSGNVRTPLFPVSDSAFYMLRAPLTVSFDRIGDDVEMTVVVDEREPESVGQTWKSWRVSTETPPPQVVAGNAAPWRSWSAGTWILVGVVGTVALALITRPAWWGRLRAARGHPG